MKLLPLMLCALLGGAGGVVHAAERGLQVYESNCMVCHQAGGQGMPGLAPPLAGAQWARLAMARNYVPGVLLAGMNGSLQLESGTFVGVMPPQNRLSDEDLAAVANYLFTTLNGRADWQALTAEELAALRASPAPVSALRAMRKQAVAT